MSPRVRDILERIARDAGTSVEDLTSARRTRSIAWPRFRAMYEIRQLRTANGERAYSYPAIARVFGDRDHTTVIHGVRRWVELNSIQDADTLLEERRQALTTLARYQSLFERLNARVHEIDHLLSKREAA